MGHLFRPSVGTRIGFSHSVSSECIAGVTNINAQAVAWGNGPALFVSGGFNPVANGGNLMSSPDGRIWTVRLAATNFACRAICYSPDLNLFVAVGTNLGGGPRVATSSDGINWTLRANPGDAANDFHGVVWANGLGLFVAVSNNNQGNNIMTSPDGINWTLQATPAGGTTQFKGIAWASEIGTLCTVSGTGAADFQVMTSTDGITWTLRDIPAGTGGANTASVAWSPKLQLFAFPRARGGGVAVGQVLTSPDGISWTVRTVAGNGDPNEFVAITWSPDQEFFVGISGGSDSISKRVITSLDGIDWFVNISNLNVTNDNNWSAICWSPELETGVMVALSTGSTQFAGLLTAP